MLVFFDTQVFSYTHFQYRSHLSTNKLRHVTKVFHPVACSRGNGQRDCSLRHLHEFLRLFQNPEMFLEPDAVRLAVYFSRGVVLRSCRTLGFEAARALRSTIGASVNVTPFSFWRVKSKEAIKYAVIMFCSSLAKRTPTRWTS